MIEDESGGRRGSTGETRAAIAKPLSSSTMLAAVCERIGDGYEITITLEERDAIAGLRNALAAIADRVVMAEVDRHEIRAELLALAGTPAAPQDPGDSGNDVPCGARTPT